jgi:MFS family permease
VVSSLCYPWPAVRSIGGGEGEDEGDNGPSMRDLRVIRFVIAHFLTVIAEWAATVGVLVLAHDRGGSSAVGLVSLAVLAPPLVFAPVAASLTTRHRAHRVRLAGFAVQTVAFGAAAVAAAAAASIVTVTACVVVGLGALNTLRPTGAVVLPATVRSTRELVSGNLWVSYADSASALIGPVVAAAAAGLGGPTAVFATCSVAAALSVLATAWPGTPQTEGHHRSRSDASRGVMRKAVAELRARPWSIGVVAAASARNLVVGAFDVLLVIMALEVLDLGAGGPGVLNALVGFGALASTLVITVVVRRSRLRPALVVALATIAVSCVVLGLAGHTIAVFFVLPLIGMCLSMVDNSSRMLLQRSTDPHSLGPMFACLGVAAGTGQLAGSAVAQAVLALGDVELALIGVGVLVALTAVASRRSLSRADEHAEVPVVEMSLLGRLQLFRAMPPAQLEAMARAAEPISVADGDEVIAQGQEGDTFYAVSSGTFDIVMNGELIRSAGQGEFFGEVALLTSRPRTATVTACGPGELLAIHRLDFLVALSGHEVVYDQALDHVHGLRLDPE